MRPVKLSFCMGLVILCCSASNAQGFLKKLKDKANAAAEKVLDKKTDEAINGKNGTNAGTNLPANPNSPAKGRNNPSNKGGQGLITTPPDVNQNITAAETSFKDKNYGEARYAIQQAMQGVELQIGQQILKSMPSRIEGLVKDSSADQVTSTGWGWEGLMIQRSYNKDDKQLRVTVANNSLWMQAINMYFANSAYAQSTGGQQNMKQTRIKGYRAVIEYNASSGYKLSVPLGQTSLLIYEGVNFQTEQEFMSASEKIDIDGIKRNLGEK